MCKSVYIDRAGKTFANLDAFFGQDANQSLVDIRLFAVKNFGYFHVSTTEGRAVVTWRPSKTTEIAIGELMNFLFDERITGCVIETYDDASDTWSTRLFSFRASFNDFLAFLTTHIEPYTANVRRAPLAPVVASSLIKVAPLLEFWQESASVLDRDCLHRFLGTDLGDRYLIIHDNPSLGMCLDELGRGMPAFAYNNLFGLLKQPFDRQPDRRYGRACIDAYRQARERWEPVVEIVDAKVDWADYGVLKRRYVRLLLPFKYSDGEVRVLSSTAPLNTNFQSLGR